jgi:hypothetical protein
MAIVFMIQQQDYKRDLRGKVHYGKRLKGPALCGVENTERMEFRSVPFAQDVTCMTCVKLRINQRHEAA